MGLFRTSMIGLFAVTIIGLCRTASARDMVGQGDFTFYLDSSAFRGKDGRVLEEIYIRIPNNEIAFERSGNRFVSRVRINVDIVDREGSTVVHESEEHEFTEDTETRVGNSLYFQTLIKRCYVPPGAYRLTFEIEDLEARKLTLKGMVKGKFCKSAVRDARLEVPEIPDDTPSFSLPEFVWSVDTVNGKTVYHPNPPRMYGLYKDTLIAYVELYLPDELAKAPTFEFKSYVLDPDGNTMSSRAVSLPNPAVSAQDEGLRVYPIVIREDLATFPAGAYSLHFSFGLEKRVLSRVRGGTFSVAWDMRTWEVPRRDYLTEARFLLGDKEFAKFRELTVGEQERMLDEMWKTEDPSPETGVNEAYEAYLDRLAYVNRHYAESTREAIFTDRGRIFMKWGPPDEFIEDVIPVNRETISEAFAIIENKYHPINYSTHGVKRYTNAVRPPVIDHGRVSQVDEGGNTSFPFELWIYNRAGEPILSRDRVIDPDIGTRYLFIDREGYGVYRLEASTKISE